MDIGIDTDSVLAGVPKQRSDGGGDDLRAALSELAAVASARVSQREQVRADVDDERIVEDAVQERSRSVLRGVGAFALVLAIAATVATMILTMPKQPHASTGSAHVAAASLAVASALGDSAHVRLTSAGQAVTLATCLAAYASDAAASPLLLPTPGRPTVIRARYVAACLS